MIYVNLLDFLTPSMKRCSWLVSISARCPPRAIHVAFAVYQEAWGRILYNANYQLCVGKGLTCHTRVILK